MKCSLSMHLEGTLRPSQQPVTQVSVGETVTKQLHLELELYHSALTPATLEYALKKT